MPKKILISTLGRGIKLQPGDKRLESRQYGYNLTTYVFRKGQKKLKLHCELCARFLAKKVVKPDKIYIVGTNESVWQIADEELGPNNYEKIIIPSGISEKEHWEMVNTIIQKLDIQKDDMIYLDITHAFRSIPLLYFVVIGYLQEIIGAKFSGCYYGMYEAKSRENLTEVIDLRLHVEFIFWLTAASVLVQTGDATPLIAALERSKISKESEIKMLITLLKDLNRNLSLINTPKIISCLKQIMHHINCRSFKKVCNQFPALKILVDFLNKSFEQIMPIETLKTWQIQYRLAKWYYSCRKMAQAIIMLSELILTYIIEESRLSQDLFNRFVRNSLNKALGDSELLQRINEPVRTSLIELSKMKKEIDQLRNLVAHAGSTPQMSLSILEKQIEESFDKLGHLKFNVSKLTLKDLKK